MKVRTAKLNDAAKCVKVSAIRTAEELRGLLKDADTEWLVIEDDSGAVAGIGIIHLWQWNKVAWVWDLTIDPKQRGKGYGRELLKGMIQAARKMGARVLMDFDSPRGNELNDLYLKNGFRICGSNDRWFASDTDATAVFYGYDL